MKLKNFCHIRVGDILLTSLTSNPTTTYLGTTWEELPQNKFLKTGSTPLILDEYNAFMSDCEEIIFSDEKVSTFAVRIELPKPSPALEKFKNRFNKFF